MDFLRKIINWLRKHPFLSVIIIIFLVVLIISIRTFINRSDGILSEPLKRGTAIDAVYGIGTVTATRSFSLKTGVIATITDLYVKEGDYIKKGEKLANIDRIIYRAPFDGVVNYLPFKVGENIFSQLPVMIFTDTKHRYLVVTLEQQGALRVRTGMKAKLSFDSIRTQHFEGVIESIYSYNSNFLARIDVTFLPAEFLPDMTADVAIVIREITKALLVPTSAIENDSVWVKRDRGIPSLINIKLGIVDGTMAEVLSGDLKEGDRVLIRRKVGP